tara:strand:+ start:799 stop:1125 length:327 start_codon:yes stop_codon:yes gene_type:complete
MLMGFTQAQYKYICHKADKGFRYIYADEEKSIEEDDYWLLYDHKETLIATVMKDTGEVHEGYIPKVKLPKDLLDFKNKNPDANFSDYLDELLVQEFIEENEKEVNDDG